MTKNDKVNQKNEKEKSDMMKNEKWNPPKYQHECLKTVWRLNATVLYFKVKYKWTVLNKHFVPNHSRFSRE